MAPSQLSLHYTNLVALMALFSSPFKIFWWPPCHISYRCCLGGNYLPPPDFPTKIHFTLSHISVNVSDEERSVRSAKQSFTLGPDVLPRAALKLGRADIRIILMKRFTRSLFQEVIPDKLKSAIIFQIYERGSVSTNSLLHYF